VRLSTASATSSSAPLVRAPGLSVRLWLMSGPPPYGYPSAVRSSSAQPPYSVVKPTGESWSDRAGAAWPRSGPVLRHPHGRTEFRVAGSYIGAATSELRSC
jgi:hypothetical protein